jgi:hypothetical protein
VKTVRKLLAMTLGLVAALGAATAQAVTPPRPQYYYFELARPVSPESAAPMVPVASLRLEAMGDDTLFTLTKLAVPEFGDGSFLSRLFLVYTGGQVPVDFVHVSGEAFAFDEPTKGSGTYGGYRMWTHMLGWEVANRPARLTDGEVSVFKALDTQPTDWLTDLAIKNSILDGSGALVLIQGVNIYDSVKYVDGLDGQVMPVPEPSTYAMLFAGLGLVALAVRRRSSR